MTAFSIVFWSLLGVLLLLGLWQIIEPVRQLRQVLERLANRDFRPVIFQHPLGLFRRTSANVRRISELLQRQDQQIADEGFSLRAILGSMVEGVMIVDAAERIRLANDALARMFEFPHSPINRTLLEVFMNPELRQAVELTLKDGRPRSARMLYRLSVPGANTEKNFEVYASALNPQSGRAPAGAVVVFHDVTQLRALEAVRREFVANVSHEFRTPLAIIGGYVETLLDGALDDRAMAEQSLKVMERHCRRLNLLIDDLLTITRMEGRGSDLEFRPVNLRDIVERVVEQLAPAIEERQARVWLAFPEKPLVSEADVRRLEQVCLNLLTNALRYGAAENNEVKVTGRVVGEFAEIAFSDNGPGVPYEDQPHLFERFYRVHKDRSRDAGGTGLGLSIVKSIILAHGGEVFLESDPGKGATFYFRIPVNRER